MKPTDNELEMAIVAAKAMRTRGQDEHHVAATLLYLYQRQQDLEKVYVAAETYLHSAQPESQRATLRRALEAARKNEQRETGAAREKLGPG
jgi:hypothetical protein